MAEKTTCFVAGPGVCPACVNRATCKLPERQRLPPGTIVFTRGVLHLAADGKVGIRRIAELLNRHSKGDWGEVSPEDAKENDLSVSQGFRVLSAYTVNDIKLWIITEADRSATTVLLPEEY